MTYQYLSESRRELGRQIEHYENIASGLGLEFLDEVEATISRVMKNPTAWTEIKPGIRRCLIHRFPYGILYHISEQQQEIIIVAVMNTYQKPGYWHSRKF